MAPRLASPESQDQNLVLTVVHVPIVAVDGGGTHPLVQLGRGIPEIVFGDVGCSWSHLSTFDPDFLKHLWELTLEIPPRRARTPFRGWRFSFFVWKDVQKIDTVWTECEVAPHLALKLIASGKLTFDERFVFYRVEGRWQGSYFTVWRVGGGT